MTGHSAPSLVGDFAEQCGEKFALDMAADVGAATAGFLLERQAMGIARAIAKLAGHEAAYSMMQRVADAAAAPALAKRLGK